MTNQEAIKELEWVYQNGFSNDLTIVGTDCILDAIRQGIDALEKAEKYRWHDLRKAPDDLPKNSLNSVIVCDNNYKCCCFAQFDGEVWVLRGGGHVYHPDVIAWKEIELFKEEVEEC